VSLKPPPHRHGSAAAALNCRECCDWYAKRTAYEKYERRIAAAEWALIAAEPLQ